MTSLRFAFILACLGLSNGHAQDSPVIDFKSAVDKLRTQANAAFDRELTRMKKSFVEGLEEQRRTAMANDELENAIRLRDSINEIEGLDVNLCPDPVSPRPDQAEQAELKASPLIESFLWRSGMQPVKMIHSREGFCFLTSINGMNQPGSAKVEVFIAEDGFWYLRGQSKPDNFLVLIAYAIRYDRLGVNPAATFKGEILPLNKPGE